MKQGVQINDLYRIKTVSQPVHFKDSNFFSVNGINPTENKYTSFIMSVDQNDNEHQWTAHHFDSHPTVSGDDLYFVRKTSHGNQIMKMDFDHQTVKQITNGFDVTDLNSSSNGRWLIYKTTETHESPKFKTTDFPPVRYVNRLVNRQDGLGWLPNHVTYRLNIMNTDDYHNQVLLKQSEEFKIKDVSSDGRQIAYIQANHPDLKRSDDISRGVYVFNRQSLQVNFITENYDQGIFHDVSFSNDNQQLALVGNDNHDYNQTVNDLWLYSFTNHRLNNITNAMDDVDVGYDGGLSTDIIQQAQNHSVLWFDDNTYVFHALHHGHSQMYVGNHDQVKLIWNDTSYVSDFNVQNEQHLLMTISKLNLPSQLVSFDINNHVKQLLFNPNYKYELNHQYASIKSFQYQSYDQQNEEGWLLMPNKQSDDKIPVVLYIHGGPHAAYGDNFFHEFQMLANNGYAVVLVNPRGSTTYGQKFQNEANGHYGEGDYQDVLSGLDAALQRFSSLDTHQVAIVGGSYGGFMVTWAVGHTDRFKTAIAQRPLTDWQSLYTTSDIGNRYVREEMQKDLFKDSDAREVYWHHSPLAYAMNVTTPVRIQHGEWDMRCPTNQSEAFFNALKQNGVKSDYIRYPQSFHGVSRNGLPSLRIKRLEDIVEWLNSTLKN